MRCRLYAEAGDDEIGFQRLAVFQDDGTHGLVAGKPVHLHAQMEFHRFFLMDFPVDIADGGAELALERGQFAAHDGDVEPAFPARRPRLPADEAGADDDGAAAMFGGAENPLRVLMAAQGEYVFQRAAEKAAD